MGLLDKTNKPAIPAPSTPNSRLTTQEYEFLFGLIKNSMFKGDQLEFVYTLTAKLQEEYFLLKEKQGTN